MSRVRKAWILLAAVLTGGITISVSSLSGSLAEAYHALN